MYQKIYHINNTLNLDNHKCFHDMNTYPDFQKNLSKFKSHINLETEIIDFLKK